STCSTRTKKKGQQTLSLRLAVFATCRRETQQGPALAGPCAFRGLLAPGPRFCPCRLPTQQADWKLALPHGRRARSTPDERGREDDQQQQHRTAVAAACATAAPAGASPGSRQVEA